MCPDRNRRWMVRQYSNCVRLLQALQEFAQHSPVQILDGFDLLRGSAFISYGEEFDIGAGYALRWVKACP